MRFFAALSFLTSIPLPGLREVRPEEVGRSTVYFPVVGAVIGLILAGLSLLFGLFLPASVVNGLLLVSLVIISGALHLDGFIDTCDGIAGHKTVEDRWDIMHDSRAGAFGIVGVFLLLLVKYVSLNSVPESLLMATLVLMPVLSRWAMVYAIFAYPYARPSGLGKVFKQGTNWQMFTIATLIALAITGVLARLAGLAIIFGVWVIIVAVSTLVIGIVSRLVLTPFPPKLDFGAAEFLAFTNTCLLIAIALSMLDILKKK